MRKWIYFWLIVVFGFLSFPAVSFGVMSSTNYTIFADSVDSGGVLSTGGTYSLQDTAGESPVGSATSSAYEVIGGYQAMDWSVLTMSITTTSISLGTLSAGVVNTADTTAVITTNVSSGYVLSVASVSGSSMIAVSDGTVSFGQEEYGLSVSGPDRAFSDDRSVIAGRILASSSTPVTGSQTVITFKASMVSGSAVGSRSQSVTLTASTNI